VKVSVAIVCAIGCSHGSKPDPSLLATVELPGFSLALPADVSSGSAIDPWTAQVNYERGELQRNGPVRVLVSWNPGGPWSVVDLGDLAKVAAVDATKPVAMDAGGGLPVVTYRGRVKGVPVLISGVACGARHFEIWTTSLTVDLDQIHRLILASVRCSPDAAKDRELVAHTRDRSELDAAIGARAPARFDLADRTGWKRNDGGKERESVLLVSSTGATLTALGFEHEPNDAALQRLLEPNQITLGAGTPRVLTHPQGSGLLRTLHCGDAWVVLMYLEPDVRAVRTPDAINGAHCLAVDDPDVVWP
jgi:hypothetical protein